MASYLLGIDVGTTGSKALLIDSSGKVVASALHEYPMSTPHPLWAEQDPGDWWSATVASIKDVIARSALGPSDILGVGLTGQMHGLVLLDKGGTVLRPCIMWNDQRTANQCETITRMVGADKLLQLTGNPVLPGFTAPKILWVHDNEPAVYSRIAKFLLPKDYIRYRLSRSYFSDVADASGTSLFDVARRTWSGDMLSSLNIPQAWLPEATESHEASSRVSADAARQTGLVAGTPIVAGAGDQAAQAVGTGILSEGIVSVTVGTSGVVFAASKKYRIEPNGRLHAFCHAAPGMWHLMGVMLSAGGSFRWYRDTLCQTERDQAKAINRDPYELLTESASHAPAGSEGLIFLPYLSGERTPYPNPNARGVFFGLSLRHRKPHLTRAVIEGVTFGLRDSLELVRSLGISIQQVRVSGGGARSALWRQIMADVFGTTITTVNVAEGAAFGAALLAGVSAGVFKTVQHASDTTVRSIGTTESMIPVHAVYEKYYGEYRALYAALVKEFDRVAAITDPVSAEKDSK